MADLRARKPAEIWQTSGRQEHHPSAGFLPVLGGSSRPKMTDLVPKREVKTPKIGPKMVTLRVKVDAPMSSAGGPR